MRYNLRRENIIFLGFNSLLKVKKRNTLNIKWKLNEEIKIDKIKLLDTKLKTNQIKRTLLIYNWT